MVHIKTMKSTTNKTVGQLAATYRIAAKHGNPTSRPLPLRYSVAAKMMEDCEPEHKAVLRTLSLSEALEIFGQ